MLAGNISKGGPHTMGKKRGKSANKQAALEKMKKSTETEIKKTGVLEPEPEEAVSLFAVEDHSEEKASAPVAAETVPEVEAAAPVAAETVPEVVAADSVVPEVVSEEKIPAPATETIPEEAMSLEQELFGTPAPEPVAIKAMAAEPAIEEMPAAEMPPAAQPRPVYTSPAQQSSQAKTGSETYSQAAGTTARAAAAKAGQKLGKVKTFFGDAPITRKFLTIMVIGALVLNAALTAGLAAIFAHDGKDKHEDPKDRYGTDQFDYDDNEDFDRDDFDDDWDNGHHGSQDNYQDPYGGYYQDPYNGQYDDRDDDEYEYYQPYQDDQQDQQNGWGQQDQQSQQDNQNPSNSNVSIGIVITENNGVYVSDVTGENARKAGFKTGDRIVSFDGTTVSDSNDLISAVQKHEAGDKVKVVVERDGKTVNIKTELQ